MTKFPQDFENERVANANQHCVHCSRKNRLDLKVRMNNKGNWTISCDDCAKKHGHRTREELLPPGFKIPDLSEHSKRIYKGEFLIKPEPSKQNDDNNNS
jgi:hypothetical protein